MRQFSRALIVDHSRKNLGWHEVFIDRDSQLWELLKHQTVRLIPVNKETRFYCHDTNRQSSPALGRLSSQIAPSRSLFGGMFGNRKYPGDNHRPRGGEPGSDHWPDRDGCCFRNAPAPPKARPSGRTCFFWLVGGKAVPVRNGRFSPRSNIAPTAIWPVITAYLRNRRPPIRN